MNAALLEAVKSLPLPDRLELVDAVWESIAAEGYEPPLSESQSAELQRRLEEHRQNPASGIPWETVKAELHEKYGKRE
jgi:putative addiction module component (TIGR02574 family)